MDRTARLIIAVLAGSALGAAAAAVIMQAPAIMAIAAVMVIAASAAALVSVRLPQSSGTEGGQASTGATSEAPVVAKEEPRAAVVDDVFPDDIAVPARVVIATEAAIAPLAGAVTAAVTNDEAVALCEPEAVPESGDEFPADRIEPREELQPLVPKARPLIAAACDTVTSVSLAVPVEPIVPQAAARFTTTDEAKSLSFDDIKMPTSAEPEAVVAALLDAAQVAGSVVSAMLWLEDPATATLRLVSASGRIHPEQDLEAIDSGSLGRALKTSSAVLEPRSAVRTGAEASTIWRYSIPIDAGNTRGVAAVDLLGQARPDLAILTRVSAALRGSLTGALALHIAREERSAAITLVETARDLSRLLDPDQVVEKALDRAVALAGAQTGSIMLVGKDGLLRIAAARGLPDDVVATTVLSEGEGIAGWVLASGQSVVVEDLDGRGPQSRRHGIRSAVSVPLADQDGILGVLNVGSRRFHARFSRSHLEALETLARIATLALRNAKAARQANDLYFDTLRALALAMETKDPYAQGGTDRVVEITEVLGAAMGLSESEQVALRIASILHDIGMNAAGDAVATCSRPLSTVEWSMLKMHPVIAADVLEQAPALCDVVPIVYHHHEHYDGRGYVSGLSAEHIPLGARILAVADAFVAMTSDRPYRSAMSTDVALDELQQKAGEQFDPHVVDALVDLASGGRLPARERAT